MQSFKYAIISAAGMGSRLGLNMPKALVPINGIPIIVHILKLLRDVENVRIVVGFREELLIDHVRKIRDDVVFVRNPDFRTTSNLHSLWLATKDLSVPFLTIDGDMLINPGSFEDFVRYCDRTGSETVLGIASAKTEEAVFVVLDGDQNILRFQRSPRTDFEWCGIALWRNLSVPRACDGYVYQLFESHLPLKAKVISCFEVDTPGDLEQATRFFGGIG